jgi:hypothetical protein
MDIITRPISPDGRIGYDEFNQLRLCTPMESGGSLCYTMTADLRDEKCALCGGAWAFSADAWSDQWYWHRYEERVHETCYVRYLDLKNRDEAFAHICALRLRFDLERQPNPYYPRGRWSKLYAYKAELTDYPANITIGVRKRVVEITVTPWEGELAWWQAAEAAFAKEDVTKSFSPTRVLLHAWTHAKEREYIVALAKLIEANNG